MSLTLDRGPGVWSCGLTNRRSKLEMLSRVLRYLRAVFSLVSSPAAVQVSGPSLIYCSLWETAALRMNKLVADKATERRVSNTVLEWVDFGFEGRGARGQWGHTANRKYRNRYFITKCCHLHNPRPYDVVCMSSVQSRVSVFVSVWFKYIYFTKLGKTLTLLSYSPTSTDPTII